jgi:hypothetical protein
MGHNPTVPLSRMEPSSYRRIGPRRAAGKGRRLVPPFPSVFAFLFVMLKRRVQASDHFRCGFKQCLGLRVFHLFYIFAKMLDEFAKFPSDIGRMRPRIS